MARRAQNRKVIYLLLAVALLQSAAIVGLLFSLDMSTPKEDEAISAPADSVEDDTVMPAWLEPVPEEPTSEEPAQEKEPPEGALSASDILASSQVIAHGLGEIGGETILNCREAFLTQYENGVRVFEADLRLTKDLQVVLRHDWRAGWQEGVSETAVPSLDEFLDKPLLEEYTPLSFRDLLLLMEEYPDVCVITDTKFTEEEIVALQFEAMLADARELGLSYLFDRMVIQVYSELSYRIVDSIHHFPHYLYTLYAEGFDRTEDTFRAKAAFCQENGIMGVTMWDYWWREDFAPIALEYGISVYAHTVNDPDQALSLLNSGVGAVYSDSLVPSDLIREPDMEEGA